MKIYKQSCKCWLLINEVENEPLDRMILMSREERVLFQLIIILTYLFHYYYKLQSNNFIIII